MKIQISLKDGTTHEVTGKRVPYTINGREYVFLVHKPFVNHYTSSALVVTHIDSGKSATGISYAALRDCENNHVQAAVIALGELVKKHGSSRVAAILNGAGN
jgi:hypothetical protein